MNPNLLIIITFQSNFDISSNNFNYLSYTIVTNFDTIS